MQNSQLVHRSWSDFCSYKQFEINNKNTYIVNLLLSISIWNDNQLELYPYMMNAV